MENIPTFFEFISDYCEKLDMNIIFSSKNGIVTMAIFFKSKDKDTHMPNLVISGTPEQLEDNFYDALKPSLNKVVEMTDNVEFFDKQIKRVADEKQKKATGTKTTTPRKKPVPKTTETTETKTDVKAVEEVKEKVAPTGETGDMFKQVEEEVKEKPKAPLEKAAEKVVEPKAVEPEEKGDAFAGMNNDIEDDF